jgi:beta-lactamase class A
MTPSVPWRLIPGQRSRRTAPALLGAVLATGVLAITAGDGARAPAAAADGVPAAGDADSPAAGTSPRPEVPPQEPAVLTRSAAEVSLAGRLRPLVQPVEVRLSVAVLDPATGRSLGYGTGFFDTASVVKVNVVAALLLRAQDEGRDLTAEERGLATAALRISDNDATHELWALLGGEAGLDAANVRLGLTETTGGGNGHWGLTQTTTADQLALLRAVFEPSSPLTAESQTLLQTLMGSVAEGQRWGISAAATEPDAVMIKNGWLPRSHNELWNINSIGRVTVDGRPYLVAVLSAGHTTSEGGILAVETAARSAVELIRDVPEV